MDPRQLTPIDEGKRRNPIPKKRLVLGKWGDSVRRLFERLPVQKPKKLREVKREEGKTLSKRMLKSVGLRLQREELLTIF